MANTFAPFGFRQYKGTGSAPTYEQVVGQAAYNAAAIFFGDPIVRDPSTGLVKIGVAGETVPLAGVFVGCKYLSVAQKRTNWQNYWPGSDVASGQTVEVYYVNDPNAQWVVQSGNGGPVTQASVGKNIDFAIGTGNTANGISGAYADFATIDVTATLPFKIVQLDTNNPPSVVNGSDQTSEFNLIVVAFNNVETKALAGN
jgi:hypothetical protein